MEPSKSANWILALSKMHNFPNVCMAPGTRRLAHRVVKGKLEHYSPVLLTWVDSVIDQRDMTDDWIEVDDPDWLDGYVPVDWTTAYALRAIHMSRGTPCSEDIHRERDAFKVVCHGKRDVWIYNFIMDRAYTDKSKVQFYMRKDLYNMYFSA